MLSIFNVWKIWRHFRAGEFVQALAGCREGSWLMESGLSQRYRSEAFYRIGMYATAARLPVSASNWRATFPVAVSLAACGNHVRALEILRFLPWASIPTAKKIALAAVLSPFMPDEALRLLQTLGDAAPSPLYAGVLLRTGNRLQAQQVVMKALQAGHHQKYPELHLLETMAEQGGEPLKQLDRLNAFLQAQGVPALSLRRQSQPPSPCNVVMNQALPSVEGPLVTVLMTTYKTGERGLAAIESLLNQTYRNLEIIVVDDASDDETVQHLAQVAKHDSRVRVLVLPFNVGTYVAKSIGMKAARGEFVTCHDSDDWSHPCKIARQVQPLLDEPELVASISYLLRMQDDGQFYAWPVHPLMRLNQSSLLFRREVVLAKAGAWDCVRTGADSEFYARLRLVFGKKAVKRIRQPLSLVAHRPGSLMTDKKTGYSDKGISVERLDYVESWGRWHIECLACGKTPYLGLLATERAFAAPQGIEVPAAHIQQVQLAQQVCAIQNNRLGEA